MLMFSLVITYFITSNLPWFMDLTFQVPMQYCSLQHRTLLLLPVTSRTGCSVCFFFALAPSLHSFWSYFSTDFRNILGTYWPGEFMFQCPIFSLFRTVHGWGSQGKNTEVACHSLLQWTTWWQNSLSWVALHGMAHSFTELDKAVVHVIRLVSFLWLWFSDCLPSDREG